MPSTGLLFKVLDATAQAIHSDRLKRSFPSNARFGIKPELTTSTLDMCDTVRQ
jgi:hypothetical protein